MIQYRSLHVEFESDSSNTSLPSSKLIAIMSAFLKKMGFKKVDYPHVDSGTKVPIPGNGSNNFGSLGVFHSWFWFGSWVVIYTVGYNTIIHLMDPKPDEYGTYPTWTGYNSFITSREYIYKFMGVYHTTGTEKSYKIWAGINYYKVYNRLLVTEFPEMPDGYTSDTYAFAYSADDPKTIKLYHGNIDAIIKGTNIGSPETISYLNGTKKTKHAFPSLNVLPDRSDYVPEDNLYNLNFAETIFNKVYQNGFWTVKHNRAGQGRIFELMGARFFAIDGYQALRI